MNPASVAASVAAIVVGALLALAVSWNAGRIGVFLGLMDMPGGRKLHRAPTPLVGGVALLLAVLPALAFVWAVAPALERPVPLWLLLSVAGLFLVGTLDDRFHLSAASRLAIAAAVLLLAVWQVPGFAVSSLWFSGQQAPWPLPGFWGLGFTLLCFVGLLNAVNMADGKNGLVIGQAILWALVLLARGPESMRPVVAAALGALLVLFPFNMRGRLFLGDGGSYGLSALFGLLAIHAWNSGAGQMRADDVALIFAVPVFDTLRLIFWRARQGKSPFTPGQDHLHHHLVARWGWPAPLPLVLALVAIPNLGALLFPGTGLGWLLLTFAGYCLLLWAARSGHHGREDAESS